MPDLTPDEMRARYLALPEGWTAGCRERDEPWVETFGRLDFPVDISNPTDALPTGYAVYLAVMHQLEGADGPRAWIAEPSDGDRWKQVQDIVDHGLGGWRYAADVEIGAPQSRALVDVLGLREADGLFSCAFFAAAHRACTLTGSALARALEADEHVAPQVWFPHDLTWFANAPYDAGWTYLACDHATARRLDDHAELEVLFCTFD